MFLKRSGILFYSLENDCPENCRYRCRQKEPIIGTVGQFYHSLTISKHYSITLPQAFICNAAFSWSNPHFLSGFAALYTCPVSQSVSQSVSQAVSQPVSQLAFCRLIQPVFYVIDLC